MRVQTEVLLEDGLDEFRAVVVGEVERDAAACDYRIQSESVKVVRAFLDNEEISGIHLLDVQEVLDLRLSIERRRRPASGATIVELLVEAACELETRPPKTELDGDKVVETISPKVRIHHNTTTGYSYFRVSWELEPGAWTIGLYAGDLEKARVLARQKAAELAPALRLVRS